MHNGEGKVRDPIPSGTGTWKQFCCELLNSIYLLNVTSLIMNILLFFIGIFIGVLAMSMMMVNKRENRDESI